MNFLTTISTDFLKCLYFWFIYWFGFDLVSDDKENCSVGWLLNNIIYCHTYMCSLCNIQINKRILQIVYNRNHRWHRIAQYILYINVYTSRHISTFLYMINTFTYIYNILPRLERVGTYIDSVYTTLVHRHRIGRYMDDLYIFSPLINLLHIYIWYIILLQLYELDVWKHVFGWR